MTRLFAPLLGITLVAATSAALGADFDVGRATLRMSDDGWVSVGTVTDELPLAGIGMSLARLRSQSAAFFSSTVRTDFAQRSLRVPHAASQPFIFDGLTIACPKTMCMRSTLGKETSKAGIACE